MSKNKDTHVFAEDMVEEMSKTAQDIGLEAFQLTITKGQVLSTIAGERTVSWLIYEVYHTQRSERGVISGVSPLAASRYAPWRGAQQGCFATSWR